MPLDPRNELFYWVDENDQELGSVPRYIAHADKNIIHRAVGIIILNDRDEMLMQKRSQKKDMDPGVWSYGVGGHVTYGQSYLDAAIREIEEEMGIKCNRLKELTKLLIRMDHETEYNALFEAVIPSSTIINPDKTEIDSIDWVHKHRLSDFFILHKPHPWTVVSLKAAGYL